MNDLSIGTRIDHDSYGEGLISKINVVSYDVYFAIGGKREILKTSDEFKVLSKPESSTGTTEATDSIDLDAFEKLMCYTLDKYAMMQEVVPLGERWTGGKMILQPAKPELKPKEIPIEQFFHKIVMLRDRLRVLEQNINSNSKLSDEEKVDLQQYITRIYGSLTTFNILFKEKEQFFIGTGGGN